LSEALILTSISLKYDNIFFFQANFDAPLDLLQGKSVFLNCEGLDTVATVVLNNVEIGGAENMFRRYRFNIDSSVLQETENSLEIAFRSPIEYANEKYLEQSQDYIVPPPCTFAQGDCHANHIRKMQSSFR
jgi:beta-mannosidase